MPHLFINSYAPLVITGAGLYASQTFGIPPFVDGSIRREPDLEHQMPSISCLCRAGKFAPRLAVGDIVIYMTKKDTYGIGPRHRRLTAVLEVRHLFDSHAEAAAWYRRQRMPLPSNCLVRGNEHKPLAESLQASTGTAADITYAAQWDQEYHRRVAKHPRFVVCRPKLVDITWSAPVVLDEDLHAVFGRVPGTRNPGKLDPAFYEPLMSRLSGKRPTQSGPTAKPTSGAGTKCSPPRAPRSAPGRRASC